MKTLNPRNFRSFGSTAIAVGALLISSFAMTAVTHAATSTPTAKPSLGGARPTIAGGGEGQGDENSAANVARRAAMTKYTDCLTAHGVSLPNFGGRGFGGRDNNQNGTPPTGVPTARPTSFPTARPTLSAAQQAGMTACASLRPAFGRGGADDANRPSTLNPSAGTIIKKTVPAPTKTAAKPKTVTPKQLLKSAYISCLNTNGVNVQNTAQIAALDKQSPKIAAALKKCASKK